MSDWNDASTPWRMAGAPILLPPTPFQQWLFTGWRVRVRVWLLLKLAMRRPVVLNCDTREQLGVPGTIIANSTFGRTEAVYHD